MTVFYTGKGDNGSSEVGSKKLSKDDLLFHALGTLDELNSWLGVCAAGAKQKNVRDALKDAQQSLFIIQAEIAALGGGYKPKSIITAGKTKELEKTIDLINLQVPAVTKFIIPGGSELSARIDYGRALARRAERETTAFAKKKKANPELLKYLNRLSSLLFALARLVNYKLKIKEENPRY
jgi:cob(I)alamin adenosyltransferase